MVDRFLEIDRRKREDEARAVEEFMGYMLDSMADQIDSYQGFNPPNLRTMDKESRRIVNEFLDVGAARRREVELGKRGPGVGVGPEESRWYSDYLTDDQILEMEARDLARISRQDNQDDELGDLELIGLHDMSYNNGLISHNNSITQSLRREVQRETESLLKSSKTGQLSNRNSIRPHSYSR